MAIELASRKDRLYAALIDAGASLLLFPLSLFGKFGGTLQLLATLALFVYQCALLHRNGQTLGKKFRSIRIVRHATGENGGFLYNVALRLGVNGLLCLIPGYFIVDALFIFRADQRCLHDFIAGTVVISCGSENSQSPVEAAETAA